MKPAVNSRNKAIVLGVLVGLFALWWYFRPYPALGIFMGLLVGLLTFFILSTRKMERWRLAFFMSLSILALTTLTANILYIGYHSFREWVRIWDIGYFNPDNIGVGSSPFPLPTLIPTILLGKATFLTGASVWQTEQASSLDLFLLFMVPYIVTFLVFGRSYCGWICPMGGFVESSASLSRRQRWSLKFLEKRPARSGEFSLVGLTGLKGWLEWVRYAIFVGLVIWSILGGFAIVNIISPALWLKNITVFWIVIGFLIVFAAVLPFFTKRRWWCDVICPVGTGLAFVHSWGLFRMKIDKSKCNECMDCVKECPMFAMTPQGVQRGGPMSGNCVNCGRCIQVCPQDAIDIAFLGKYGKVREAFLSLIISTVLAWYLWFVVLLVSYSTRLGNFKGLK